ncbi:hypothetical protein FCM30_18595 [Lelliottia aquatilis]|uniref:hypothetical protein n=1 Tax=Lelliottia aquatilis TaxID=2080838 RepID=UPI001574F062|nr:hypothetical protein [Lelliottia aquatilis]NTZ47752.1 hypothetical protein [Lelliottia aquatilis]
MVEKVTRTLICVFIILGMLAGLSYANTTLNTAQQQYLNQVVKKKISHPSDQVIVDQWPESSRVAEFLCRPQATLYFKQHVHNVDKVILYTGDENAPELISQNQLKGAGEYRQGEKWTEFQYQCELSETTGKAVSFKVKTDSLK